VLRFYPVLVQREMESGRSPLASQRSANGARHQGGVQDTWHLNHRIRKAKALFKMATNDEQLEGRGRSGRDVHRFEDTTSAASVAGTRKNQSHVHARDRRAPDRDGTCNELIGKKAPQAFEEPKAG
jgi:hypothetical protein